MGLAGESGRGEQPVSQLTCRASSRRQEAEDFNRGADRSSAPRQLYDPARSPLPVVPRAEEAPRRRPPVPPPHAQARNEPATKKLFNPDVHDPHQFQRVRAVPSESSSGSRGLMRKPAAARTPEEEADRERERRKRREGSERGSLAVKKKDSDTRSKGSRSSEGSESLKDRERGKGKA